MKACQLTETNVPQKKYKLSISKNLWIYSTYQRTNRGKTIQQHRSNLKFGSYLGWSQFSKIKSERKTLYWCLGLNLFFGFISLFTLCWASESVHLIWEFVVFFELLNGINISHCFVLAVFLDMACLIAVDAELFNSSIIDSHFLTKHGQKLGNFLIDFHFCTQVSSP